MIIICSLSMNSELFSEFEISKYKSQISNKSQFSKSKFSNSCINFGIYPEILGLELICYLNIVY